MLCVALFPLFIGLVPLFDWDEINFAEIAREMLLTKKYLTVQLNYLPFWEKPPLFFWIQATSQYLLGVNEFASRLPNAIVGVFSIFYLYAIGKKYYNSQFGFLWGLAYVGSFLPHFYFKSGIIDPLFNLWIVMSLHQFYEHTLHKTWRSLILASLFLGLACLTKGPVAILIVVLCVGIFLCVKKFKVRFSVLQLLVATMIVIAVTAVWVLPEMLKGGGLALFKDFIAYQIRLFSTSEAGHGQPFYYHFIVLLLGCFPISFLAFPTFLHKIPLQNKTICQKDFFTLHFILFWVVLILFSLTTTKIVHYSSLCYFPLSFLAANAVFSLMQQNKQLSRFSFIGICIVGILFAFIFIGFPLLIFFKQELCAIIQDKFVVGNLSYPVSWNGFECVIGVFYLLTLCVVLWKLKKNIHYVFHLFLLNAIVINLLLVSIVPKLEQHIQGAYIQFLQQHRHDYVLAYGFKSYAQYFYADKQLPQHLYELETDWLLHGAIDKPVFIIAKIFDKENVLQHIVGVKYLYEAGGFVFFERPVKKKQ